MAGENVEYFPPPKALIKALQTFNLTQGKKIYIIIATKTMMKTVRHEKKAKESRGWWKPDASNACLNITSKLQLRTYEIMNLGNSFKCISSGCRLSAVIGNSYDGMV